MQPQEIILMLRRLYRAVGDEAELSLLHTVEGEALRVLAAVKAGKPMPPGQATILSAMIDPSLASADALIAGMERTQAALTEWAADAAQDGARTRDLSAAIEWCDDLDRRLTVLRAVGARLLCLRAELQYRLGVGV